MKTPAKLINVSKQSLVLELGCFLTSFYRDARSPAVRNGTAKPVPEQVDEMVTMILTVIDEDALRCLLGVHRKMDASRRRMRVTAIAFMAWQSLRLDNFSIDIGDLASVICANDTKKQPAEAFLHARNECGCLIKETVLIGKADKCERPAFSQVFLPMRTLIWLAGGQDSLGIYTLKQAAEDAYSWNAEAQNDVSAPKNLSIAPTARQLYEATREYVIGCDDGLKTLASRIVLAGIRADMLASGKNDTGVGNQVICVFGSSGAGKTFLVQELARRTNFLFSSFDASTITGEGWAGAKVEDAMKFALNCEPQKASRAIVCYDEVDKVLRSGTSEHRLSVQGEFLRPLGGETIIVGGKRMQDCRPFSYDCRPTCFVFSGVFDGLQELAERGSCRPSIGFHSISGEKRHADFRRALASYGCIDELVNRISCFIGLPDPTANSIARAIVAEHGIVQGYNRILLAHNIVLFPQQSAVSYLSEYGVDSKTFYRGVKHLVGSIVEEILFDGTTGTVMLDAALVRRAIDRQGGNILPETAKPTTPSVERFDEPPAEADLEGISAQKHYRNC